jgi:predicted metal-dependent HD superfamily phosphohydrolase
MKTPDFVGAVAYAIGRLRSELSPNFTYHNLWHTQHEVMPIARKLASMSQADEADIQLLEVATAFHDIGFIEVNKNHELTGARIVAQVLPDFGFSSAQIEIIMGLIIATRLPQSPCIPLEKCIADADLDVLGRDDFIARNSCLREEMANGGTHFTDQSWLEGQLEFAQSHNYFTAAARNLRGKYKNENIAIMQKHLAEIVTKKG